jgi:Tfp pilus assembly protein PilW
MLLAQFGLIALLLAIVILPRVIAIYYSTRSNAKSEEFEYDYR